MSDLKETIVIVGAGAIGRGYLPWTFEDNRYNLILVDQNVELIRKLKEQGYFTSYMTMKGKGLVGKKFMVDQAYTIDEFQTVQCPDPVTCYMAVGPRNVVLASKVLKRFTCPIVLLENDDKTVELVRVAVGRENVFFAIPDVIASNTASLENLQKDPLALHTEDGEMFVDARAKAVAGRIIYCDELELKNQWAAKLYLHNTPHCIAAYLGSLLEQKYVHDPMGVPKARKIVEGAMNEMLRALKLTWDIPHDFLDWYAAKELDRFSNRELCDPISRVAREPFRKLELNGRLVGAALMCLKLGYVPINLLLGITAALLYKNESDQDNHIAFAIKYLSPAIVLSYLLKLRKGEVLEELLSSNFVTLVDQLEEVMRCKPC